ncbi:MAG: flagellar basal body L-ring protein FlgH [Desulfobacteraceae bacterium]|jgi:flagellar L-ring protein precursor FlgH
MQHLQWKNASPILLGLLVAILILTGCATPPAIQSGSSIKQHAYPAATPSHNPQIVPVALNQHTGGSLWVEHGAMGELFINPKARHVGDIVTIKIVETSSASNKASTDTDRTTSLGVGLTGFFNLEDKFSTNSKFFNPFAPVQSDYESEFQGSGTTVRSGALTAYITARIVQILPNGNFIIEGNREVRVNNENQVITLTGVVRPRDITADNVIQSTYIADAKISYSGSGIVNDQQRPGWLMRILDNVWPF